MLAELYPDKSTRDYLPLLAIIYMGPGGHRQWPMSISALLDRLSWLVLQTRPLALSSFQAAVQKNQRWGPRYRSGPTVAVAPPPAIKFLDIGTKMGCYKIGEHIPGRDDTSNIFHPRFVGEGIPAANTFHSIIYQRLGRETLVKCGALKRHGLHTHLSTKLGWIGCIPREWVEIATHSLKEWREREREATVPSGQSERLCKSDCSCPIQEWQCNRLPQLEHQLKIPQHHPERQLLNMLTHVKV